MGQPPTSCSTGASARPIMIELAIIPPGVIACCKTSQAPAASIALCRNRRKLLENTVKPEDRSAPLTDCSCASARALRQRA